MAELNIPDLCGGSAEIAGVQIKFDALIKSGLDGLELDASALSVTIGNDVLSLTAELRKAVPPRPTLPNFNLPAQLTGLSRLPAGSSVHKTLLASIKTKFGDGLTAGGFSLDALVSKAGTQIKLGLDLCTAIPNFEAPAAGGDAVEKAIESKHSTEDSEEEKPSTVVKNANLTAEKAAVEKKAEAYDIGETLPTEDTGPYKPTTKTTDVATSSVSKTEAGVSSEGSQVIKTKVTTAKNSTTTTTTTGGGVTIRRSNVSEPGFSRRPIRIKEYWKESDFDKSELKHPAIEIHSVRGWDENYKDGKGRWRALRPETYENMHGEGWEKRGHDVYSLDDDRLLIDFTGEFYDYGPKPRSPHKDVIMKISYSYADTYDPNFAHYEDEG